MIGLLAGAFAAPASAAVLYDSTTGTSPASQGWLFHTSLLGGSESFDSTATTFDTTADISTRNGYANYGVSFDFVNSSFPTLDRTSGFTIDLTARINSESHSSTDRAGFSLIAISSDLQGIELGFWEDAVWAQNAGFTHGESASIDTKSAMKSYSLNIIGSTYTLAVDGIDALSGNLRYYQSQGYPYTLSSFLFLGDDTTSAEASVSFSNLAVTVPEPTTISLLGATSLLLLSRRRRRCA
jgi:hypothetical protein